MVARFDGVDVTRARGLLREAAVGRVGVGLAVGDAALSGDGLTDDEDGAGLSGDGRAGVATTGPGRARSGSAEVRCTAPTVPPTATATATAAEAAMPAGEENIRIRGCLPAIDPSFRLLTNRLGP
ncbi:hypothetical protein GCM10017556_26890 [Micromonospora sagamiensis]|nr:hypothetical protein GCM10017556_26890 [Micromonospora sagamiensis]